jgi:membrane fusion protein, multidrug efflux system
MAGRLIPMNGLLERCRDKGITGTVLVAAITLFALGIAPGCTKEHESREPEIKLSSVKVVTVGKKNVRPYIEAIGSLNPHDEVTISSEVDGILKELTVTEGSHVSPDMVLARINDISYRLNVDNASAAVKQAEASLMNLGIEHKRKEALYSEKLVTIQQFDDVTTRLAVAEQDLDRAKVALSLAQEMLTKATIKSPKGGIVKARLVTTGDFIRASMPILSIVQINPLKLTFTITEKDVGALRRGQEILFTVDPFPGKQFRGTISVIYPSLDERTRTLKVEATVPNNSLELKPGFFARLKIYTGFARNAVVIPATSILYEGARFRVFLQEGERAREKGIRPGMKHDDMVEVLEGLKGGEKLITVGQNGLSDGDAIFVER